MSLPDELQSLAALKAKGALSEQEFAQAKAAVIAKYGGTSTATPVATAAQHKQGITAEMEAEHKKGIYKPNGRCHYCGNLFGPEPGRGPGDPNNPNEIWCYDCSVGC